MPDLLIDLRRIQHVAYALAQNAIDAGTTTSDSPSIRIEVSADRHSVETGVTDSGPAVPADFGSDCRSQKVDRSSNGKA